MRARPHNVIISSVVAAATHGATHLTATKLIATRVVLGIIAVSIFTLSPSLALVTVALFITVELVDIADGLIAERQGQKKAFGGFLDITSDQGIELLFWFVLLRCHTVPLWIPSVIVVRNSFVNLLRVQAISAGEDMFGPHSMLHSRVAHILVGTRASRGIMVLAKTIGFVGAMLLHIGITYGRRWVPIVPFRAYDFHLVIMVALICLVLIHIIRGFVIVLEARDSLAAFLWRSSQGGARDATSS